MVCLAALADFGPVPGSEVRARNGQERVECGAKLADGRTGEVRRLPQEPPNNTREPAQKGKKKPQPRTVGVSLLVEAAGIEPASASPLPRDLHA